MPKITYIEFNSRVHVVDVKVGQSVMEGAIRNNIPGIDADCGGACACATCHIYVDPAWIEKTGNPSENETALLDFNDSAESNSRLACQIAVTAELDGLIIHMPEAQI